jgi:serine phosphatase RsbU (regulator of sigma subunit)
MIGTILLNEIYYSKRFRSPSQILDELNRLVQLTLMSHNSQMKDGMDMSFCSLNKETNVLAYAGANNPIWIVSKKSTLKVKLTKDWEDLAPNIELNGLFLYEVKADKQPIGRYHDEQQPFSLKEVQLAKDDCVYLFSDGYPDQFGGEKWKKFKYKPLKRLFLSINEKPMSGQLEVIQKTFDDWRGDNEQVDDVCVLGVKV